MKFILENQPHYAIQGYDGNEITVAIAHENSHSPSTVATKKIAQSFILSTETLQEQWQHADITSCTAEDFKLLLDFEPEVVIISTGSRIVFPPPEALQAFFQQNIGVEIMATGAACRTFNVLASEYRKVIAGFILP